MSKGSRLVVCLLGLLLAGCASDRPATLPPPPPPGGSGGVPGPIGNDEGLRLHLTGGNGQTGILGVQLPVPFRVLVSEDGIPKAGVAVRFEIASGSGVLSDVPLTDQSGSTRASYRPLVLGPHSIIAGIVGSGASWASFGITAGYGPPRFLAFLTPSGQPAVVGTAVAIPPEVVVEDQGGNRLPGVAIRWQVLQGGGTLVRPDTITGSDGRARIEAWILGTEPGSQLLSAEVVGTGLIRYITAVAVAAPGP